ncbi:hypothetical protein ACOMHN_040792 [Nucella lapillus]
MAAPIRIFNPEENPVKIVKWKVKKDSMVMKGSILGLYTNSKTNSDVKLKSTETGIVDRIFIEAGMDCKPGSLLVTLRHQDSGGCTHPTVMKDMCAECGADLRNEFGVAGDRKEKVTASVAMVHNIPELIISQEQALELGREDEQRLLKTRKLVLLVDLDQTLIHTTNDNIPPRLKDVFHFQLWQGPKSPWCHTRLRPHTCTFLEHISQMYELHICTFGVRLYAHKVARLMDPDEKFFSHRILSRDECFDPLSKTANLKALFPCGDGMVCIIDDREDVWNHAPNLVHVKPYRFFQGTADINAPPGLDKSENDDIPLVHKVVDHHDSGTSQASENPQKSGVQDEKSEAEVSNQKTGGENSNGKAGGDASSQKSEDGGSPDQKTTVEDSSQKTEGVVSDEKSGSAISPPANSGAVQQETMEVDEGPADAVAKDTAGEPEVQSTGADKVRQNDKKDTGSMPEAGDSVKRTEDRGFREQSVGGGGDNQGEPRPMETSAHDQVAQDLCVSSDSDSHSPVFSDSDSSRNRVENGEGATTTVDSTAQSASTPEKTNTSVSVTTSDKPDDAKTTSDKPDDNKTTSDKADDNKTTLDKADDNKTTSDKADDNNTTSDKEDDNNTTSDKADDNNTTSDKADDNKTTSDKADDNNTTSDKADDNNTTSDKADDNKTTSDKADDNNTSSDKPDDNKTTSDTSDSAIKQNKTGSGDSDVCSEKTQLKRPDSMVESKAGGSEEEEWDDEDDYLLHLEEILTRIHQAFYTMVDERNRPSPTPTSSAQWGEADPRKKNGLPDLKSIIPYVKRKTLKGCNIVLSGVVPLNTPLEKSQAYVVAKALGATVQPDMVGPKEARKKEQETTHLVAAKPGTCKHRSALHVPNVNIVHSSWLWACNERWERCDERLFPLPAAVDHKHEKKDHHRHSKRKMMPSSEQGDSEASRRRGKRRKTHDEGKGKRSRNGAGGSSSEEGTSGAVRRRDSSFADSVPPLMSFSDEDLECMDKEVDELMAEEDSGSEDETDEERDQRYRDSVLGSVSEGTSSSDSLSGDLPRGWGLRRKRSSSPLQGEDDLEKQKLEVIELETEDTESEMVRFQTTVEAFSPNSDSSNSSFAESIGSVDDELAEAVEKEFLGSL